MTELRKLTLYDENGNPIAANANYNGDYHLNVSTIQKIETAFVSTSNINASSTYTSDTFETLGVNAIQVFCFTDRNCTLYLDQGVDGTNWDITDELSTLANIAISRVIYSVAPYFRVRVTNTSTTATTEVRIAAGMTPVINPLPRALTDDQRLKVESTISGRENTARHVWVNPTNELAISPVYRMVGTAFDNTTLDENFWTPTYDVGVNGSITQDGGILTLQTSANANSFAKYTSVRKARFVPGSAQLFTAGMAMTAAPIAGNTRRVGAYDGTSGVDGNGYFMQVAGTTFSVGTRKDGTDSLVSTGSFNGNYGPSWSPSLDTFYKVQIEFTPLAVIWYIDGVRLHSIKSAGLSDTLTLPITLENANVANTSDIDLQCVGAYIARQGELITNPIYYHVSGNAVAEKILKYGAGVLHKVVYNNVSGTSLTLYDGDVATGNVIGIITTTANAIGTWTYDAPFSNGLAIKTIGNSLDATIVYE